MSRLIQHETSGKCLDHIATRMPSADDQGGPVPVRADAVATFRSDQSCGGTGTWWPCRLVVPIVTSGRRRHEPPQLSGGY
jgi:hypothetical protein